MKKITLREKIILVAAFLLIAVILFENLFRVPLKESMDKLQKDIAKREEIIAGLETQQKGYNSITLDLQRSIKDYNAAVDLFPSGWDDSLMLNYLEEIIGDDLIKRSLSFNGLQAGEGYVVGTYNVSVFGHFEDIIDLLYALEDAKYYNTVTSVYLPIYTYDNDEVDAQFTVNFYAITE